MTTKRAGRAGRPWRTASEACYQTALANQSPCWRCGGPIDYSVPKASTRWSYTTGHIIRIEHGGHPTDLTNLAAEHAYCNYRDGADSTNTKRRTGNALPPLRTSRQWL